MLNTTVGLNFGCRPNAASLGQTSNAGARRSVLCRRHVCDEAPEISGERRAHGARRIHAEDLQRGAHAFQRHGEGAPILAKCGVLSLSRRSGA